MFQPAQEQSFLCRRSGAVAVPPGSKGFQHMRLIKDGDHIQLQANGKVSIDWTDNDAARFGPPHGGGK